MAFPKGTMIVFFLVLLCSSSFASEKTSTATHYNYNILNTYPHDSGAFTQGLIVQPDNPNYFIEGTGMYSHSQLRRVKIETGEVVERYSLESRKFGEGVTFWNGFYYQLTWKSRAVYVYKQEDDEESVGLEFGEPVEVLSLPLSIKEGWGLTTDGDFLILSEGSDKLYYLNEALEVIKTVEVKDEFGIPLKYLNELEYIEGEIWANVWFSSQLYIISPESGEVVKMVDLATLESGPRSDVLNGIAYEPVSKKIYVTGKLWSWMYEIELVEQRTLEEDDGDDVEEDTNGAGRWGVEGLGALFVIWGGVLALL